MVGPRQALNQSARARWRSGDRMRSGLAMALAVLLLGACAAPPESQIDKPEQTAAELWENQARDWRERRLARLTEPFGWLSLVGLEFLEPGRWRVGHDQQADIALSSGPAHWGDLIVIEQRVWFEPAPGADVRINGQLGGETELLADSVDGPTLIEAGSVQFHLLDRSGQPVLRIRDHQAPTRVDFAGLEHFAFDPDWRIDARWRAHPPGRRLLIANVLGELIHEPNPGMAEFEFQGRTFGLEAVAAGDQLFFILADRTSGRETYGLGRFLYSDLPENGRVVLDFNRSYNPPCAFTEFSTCPLPPPENRLDIRITAGEKTYIGAP